MVTHDKLKRRKDSASVKKRWTKARRAEDQFARKLRGLAKQVGTLTKQMVNAKDVRSTTQLQIVLRNYANTIRPWAQETAKRMVLDVSRRDESVWNEIAREMAVTMKKDLRSVTGTLLRQRINEVADLITSLPLEAAQRVQHLTVEAISTGGRVGTIVKEIMKTGEVTQSRAMLIARTETSRTASELVRVRSQAIGATHYIWRTSGDSDVRKEHRRLNGKVIAFDRPPIAGTNGMRYHAGQGPNCRCYVEPVIPDFA